MTFIEKFEAIEKKMKSIDPNALKEEFAIQVTMNDEDCGGTFYIANIGGEFNIKPYNYYDNTVAVVCSAKDFTDIISGKADFEKYAAENKIEIYGNENHAKLLSLLVKKAAKRTTRKPAAKKPAEAKATSSKAAAVKKEAPKPAAAKKEAPTEEIKTEEPKKEVKKPAEKKTETKKTVNTKKA